MEIVVFKNKWKTAAFAAIAIISFISFIFTNWTSNANPKTTALKSVPLKPAEEKDTPILHEVRTGESLWRIARKYYGKGSEWNKIQSPRSTTIIRPGDVVQIPSI